MALVAYDNSDSSDSEENYNETIPIILKKENKEPIPPATQDNSNIEQNVKHGQHPTQSLFNQLPRPNHKKTDIIEEEDEFLYKKETSDLKPKSKITVPSLSEFKDVKDTVPSGRPKISNGKKSGLLSILPQPKHSTLSTVPSRALIPNVITQKPQGTTAKKKDLIISPSKKPKLETKSSTNILTQYSDDSDNDDVENDFFSINKPVEVPIEELPLDIELPTSSKARVAPASKPRSIESYFKQNIAEKHSPEVHNDIDTNNMYTAQGSNQLENTASRVSSETALDEEAILKLCGSRGKRKKEAIEIVDVNQQEVLADAREWLLKGLMDDTSKRVSASKKRGNEPTSQQKRKHQITYLAHQAKANEIELQNQWANNRMTKRQTQSKYGF